MANDLTGDPYLIDTAAAGTVITADRFIYGILYSGGTTAGHAAELVQTASPNRVFWRATCLGAGDSKFYPIRMKTPHALALATLGSGKILVYLGPER